MYKALLLPVKDANALQDAQYSRDGACNTKLTSNISRLALKRFMNWCESIVHSPTRCLCQNLLKKLYVLIGIVHNLMPRTWLERLQTSHGKREIALQRR